MRFLNKKTIILGMAVLTVFLLANFASRGNSQFSFVERFAVIVLSPVESLLSQTGYGIRNTTNFVSQLFTLAEENQTLRANIDELRQNELTITEIMAENIRLRAMLEYKKGTPQFDFITAAVIARDPGMWTNIMMINRGSNDGLTRDMPVVTPQGLVGNIVQVSASTAKIQLLLDPRSAVGSLVQRPESRVAAVVEGNGISPMAPRMVNLARDADIIRGDKIITSGFGGIYPKGLLVGEVMDIVNDEGGLLKYAVLKPVVDFDRLEEVMVIVRSRESAAQLPGISATPNSPQPKGVPNR